MDSRLQDRVRHSVEGLAPGYFALVMGSGIVSVGMKLEGFDVLSGILMWLCVVSYIALTTLTAWRWLGYRESFLEDFADPRRAFGFFTFVAGTNVLGVRLSMSGWYDATGALLALSFTCWVIFGYVVPWTSVLGRAARPVVASANGTWFIWVVASQSVAVASASLEPVVGASLRRELALTAVFSWSVGLFLYAAVGVLVMLRMMLYELRPVDLTPPYWVAMGACAITVLAGARIVEMADAPMVNATRGLVAGMSVVVWAFATWLIPPLVAAGWWRHVYHKVPLVYDATWWSVVFPLGMYAVAGLYLGRADNLPIVGWIGRVELWVGFTALLLTFVMMVRNLWRTVAQPTPQAQLAS